MSDLEKVNCYLNNNSDYVYNCAKNILKRVGRIELYVELVSEAYLYITQNINKLNLTNDSAIESIFVNYMNKQIAWSNSDFKKKYIYIDKSLKFETILLDDIGYGYEVVKMVDRIIDDYDDEMELEILLEQQRKLNTISINYAKLTLDKKILYDMVFNQGINTSGKLAKHININRTSAYYLIKDLKETLRNGIDD